ncbi:hypothetical protein GGI12_003160 [Dipsacomyces acuminosporus]|nr:hypothetical protein GGI12_003160 [Dipsacomyces acuminosporus]
MSHIPEATPPHFVRSTGGNQQQQASPTYAHSPQPANLADQYSPRDTMPVQQHRQPPAMHPHHPPPGAPNGGFYHGQSIPLPPPHGPPHHPHPPPYFAQQQQQPPLLYDDRAHHPALGPNATMDGPWSSAATDIRFRVPITNAEERERKRRISHSAMERRRRERTNTIINELKGLIPWLRNEARLQKLEVLEQCVCYIKELQSSAASAANSASAFLSSDTSITPASPSNKRRREQADDDDDNDYKIRASTSPASFSSRHSMQSDGTASPAPRASSPDISAANALASLSPSILAAEASRRQTSDHARSPVHTAGVGAGTGASAGAGSTDAAATAREDAEEEPVTFWDAPGQLSSSDLPDLTTDSGPSSKASSTVSTITPFRGPVPKEIAESKLNGKQSPQTQEPAVKNSIDFLTS